MADVSRRAVLTVGAGSIGLAVIGLEQPAAQAATTAATPLRAHYQRSIGGLFTAVGAHGRVQLRLAEITDLVPLATARRAEQFNLIFTVVSKHAFTDGIYSLQRKGVFPHSLFVSNAGLRSAHRVQALVNR
jgi:hypothetical protein